MVKTSTIFINGLWQDTSPSDGLFDLYWEAYHTWADRTTDFLMHTTERANMKDAVDLILRHCPTPDSRIVVVAFSYGAGRGLTSLAAELLARGRSIDLALLIDPVTAHPWPLRWRALGWGGTKGLTYKVPANVREVRSWRQVNHYGAFQPVGHVAVASDFRTVIRPEVVLGDALRLGRYLERMAHEERTEKSPYVRLSGATHSSIDQDPKVRAEVLAALKEFNPPSRKEAA